MLLDNTEFSEVLEPTPGRPWLPTVRGVRRKNVALLTDMRDRKIGEVTSVPLPSPLVFLVCLRTAFSCSPTPQWQRLEQVTFQVVLLSLWAWLN